MKKLLTLFALVCLTGLCSTGHVFAQSESLIPALDFYVIRDVHYASINGEGHTNVTVELKSTALFHFLGVKVIVRDKETGKKIYAKRFWKSFLYVFPDRSIHVERGNEGTQVSLHLSDGRWELGLNKKGG
jgi:hypothetical protein